MRARARARGRSAAVVALVAMVLMVAGGCGAARPLSAVAVAKAGNLAALKATRWVPTAAGEIGAVRAPTVANRVTTMLVRVRDLDPEKAGEVTLYACEIYAQSQLTTDAEMLEYVGQKISGSPVEEYRGTVEDLVRSFLTESRRDFAGKLAVAAACEAADQLA